ncbi:MAG: 5-methylcytosine-specific restriction endonuclease system specificity protein McrC [Solobacterium sp.]|nr:5-methylcytosine-specific restriction endonuclease system specificity protein McrC [Solobacterium sp.]
MLSYAFQVLKEQGPKEVDAEVFDNAQRLCAEILIKGISVQIKRGLKRDYVPQTETLSSVKGKIDVSDSLKTQSILRRRLVCNYDEFTTDTKLNQILKTTMLVLLRGEITNKQKKELKKLLVYFSDVSETDIHTIDWNMHYNRNDQSYQLLITICYMVIKGLIQAQSDGTYKMMDFFDEQRMSRLYEKFILEYYRKHYPELNANPSPIEWQLDQEGDGLLPAMKTDIMLQKDNNVLIIDAKYYSHTTQEHFDKHSIHSANLYQIFTYVKNKEYELKDQPHVVSGMLLYAKTDEEIQPDSEYCMSGNRIVIKTLDLNNSFDVIQQSLNNIVSNYEIHD